MLLLFIILPLAVRAFLFPTPSCNTCSCPVQQAPPPCPPPAPCPIYSCPVVQTSCCSTCTSCQGKRIKRDLESLEDLDSTEEVIDAKCNSPELKEIIVKNMDRVTSVAKKRMQAAAETVLGARYNVICARGDLSYVANTEQYCQHTVGDVTCFLFKQLSDVVRRRLL